MPGSRCAHAGQQVCTRGTTNAHTRGIRGAAVRTRGAYAGQQCAHAGQPMCGVAECALRAYARAAGVRTRGSR
eukprot:4057591-Pyramimonas_sp.AAC.1